MVCQTSSLVCTRSGLDAAGFSLREDRKQAPSTSPGTTYCPLIEKNFEQRLCAGENPHPSLPQQTGEGAGDPRPSAEAAAMQRSPSRERRFGARRTWSCERCHRGNMQDDPLRGRCDVGACEDVSQWSRCCGMKRALRRNECELEL